MKALSATHSKAIFPEFASSPISVASRSETVLTVNNEVFRLYLYRLAVILAVCVTSGSTAMRSTSEKGDRPAPARASARTCFPEQAPFTTSNDISLHDPPDTRTAGAWTAIPCHLHRLRPVSLARTTLS